MIFSKIGSAFARTNHFDGVLTTSVRGYSQFATITMPRDMKKYYQQLQKQRKRIKQNSIKYTPTFAYLQVIGQGNFGEPRSVFLCTDHWNYVFNCGEGTQRLACEHHAKLAKTENIFVTRPTWNNIGGLPGVVLTIQETGLSTIYLHGPEDSIGVIEATENFMNLNELTVKPVNNTQPFKDQTMTVNYVLIQKPSNRPEFEPVFDFENNPINFYAYQTKNRKRPHSPPAKEKRVLKKNDMDDLMIFICKLDKKLGTLNFEKCMEFNVPAGPLLGKLKAGEDIQLEDGTIVKSADVVAKSDNGPSFIVLECPDKDWIELITKNEAFEKYQISSSIREDVSCIVHFTPETVLNDPRYKEWMHKFGPDTTHLIINEKNTGYCSEAVHRMQHQLHLIHPTIFPFFENQQKFLEHSTPPKHSLNLDEEQTLDKTSASTAEVIVENKDLDPSFLNEKLKVRRCKVLDAFHLRLNTGLDTEKNIKINPNLYIQEAMDVDGFLDSLADLQTEINVKTKALGENLEEYPRLLMLGTGSAIPNKVRNTSAMLLQINEESSIVLDCGEATVCQIIKFFGETEAEKILKTIKAVYVSHLHADHHLGLIGILEHRKLVSNDPIYLIAPQQIMGYLCYYNNNLNRILDNFIFVGNRDLLMEQLVVPINKYKDLLESLNISKIETQFVTHCPFSFAVAITLEDGRKICYSGDTMPCEKLNQIARGSFLLIHEATMEDALENDAVTKRHSTVSQAVHTGVKAEAKFTLLTHFSQRYCKLPLLPDTVQSGHDYSNVGIAYDFMLISLSKLPLLPLFYKTLGVMFSEFRESLYQRAIKRDYMKQRL